jgi:hypothetical protein
MRMAGSPLLKYSLRGLLAWALLSAAGFLFAGAIVYAFLPLMEAMIDALQSDFTAYLSVADSHGSSVIAMSCTAARQLTLPSGKIIPFLGSYKCASVDSVHALVPIVIYCVAVLAWPIRQWREVYRRLFGSLLLLPTVVALTTPLLLIGIADAALYPQTFRSDGQLTALWQPFVFLEMGGDWLVPVIAAAVCIRLAAAGAKARTLRLV